MGCCILHTLAGLIESWARALSPYASPLQYSLVVGFLWENLECWRVHPSLRSKVLCQTAIRDRHARRGTRSWLTLHSVSSPKCLSIPAVSGLQGLVNAHLVVYEKLPFVHGFGSRNSALEWWAQEGVANEQLQPTICKAVSYGMPHVSIQP